VQAAQAVEIGIEIVEDEMGRGLDIVATGDMGIGVCPASCWYEGPPQTATAVCL
jgi:hypothetical protein